ETGDERLAGRRGLPHEQERAQREDRQNVQRHRREARDRQRAPGAGGGDGEGGARLQENLQALAGSRCTCRTWSLRLSARSTWTRSPSIVIDSPRLGRRPKRFRTSPPTVSKSASEYLVPNARLKSEISVCALTRKRPPCSRTILSCDSSKSYSSSMSPTICSSTSSMVTSPETPPYSSTTRAM